MAPISRVGTGPSAPAPRVSVAASVARFPVAGFVVTLALGAVSGVIAERAGAAQVTRSFQRLADVIADAVVTPQLLHGDLSAQEALRTTVTRLVNRGPVVHVRVWDATGRTVWADDPQLIGQTTRLPADLQKALDGQSSVVSSDGGRPSTGSSATADPGNLLTVYAGVQNDDATPLLVALSERYRDMQTTAKRDWMLFGPASLGALLLLELLQIPFAWSLVVGLAPTRSLAGDLTRALEQLADRLGEPGTHVPGRTTGVEDLPGPAAGGTEPRTERGERDEGDR